MTEFTVFGFTSILNRLLPEPHAGLLAGLLFGTKASLPRDLYDALVVTGTLHIIALSGQNISIMEDLIGKVLLPIVGKWWASLLTIGVVIWFVWFVGFSPSIVRAAIMGSMSLIAVLFGRQYWAILSWTITVGIMLIINARWLTDISFQLSALATLGIILFGNKKESVGHRGIWHMLSDDLRLTLSAQVFTIPLILFSFHRLSLVSPLSNLAIGWVIAPVTMMGWLTIFVGYISLYAGQIFAWIDWVLLEYIIRTIQIVSRIPFASIGW